MKVWHNGKAIKKSSGSLFREWYRDPKTGEWRRGATSRALSARSKRSVSSADPIGTRSV